MAVVCERDGMIDFDIRTVEEHERRAVVDTFRAALLSGPVSDENYERGLASWDDTDSLTAWDGDRCVGNVAAYRFESTIPGGARVATAGITRVGVLPTHTRQGILTRLMHRLLVESRQRGQVIATLHASETPIYRRFGFGLASDAAAAEITSHRATPWRVPPVAGAMRLLRPDEVLTQIPPLYERVARWRVGSISRPSWWWARTLLDATRPAAEPFGKGSFVAVHVDADGNDDGFVSYTLNWDQAFGTNPAGRGEVHDLWGADADVELALWRYLIGIDLVLTWQAEPRPVDEPVRRAMHDARAYRGVDRFDDQWLRILDLDAALTQRTFGPGEPVALRIQDPLFEPDGATWVLSADGAERTDAAAGTGVDVDVGIETVSAAYLGAVSWHDLAAAGQVAAPASVLERLDALFAVRPTPFCGTGY